HCSPASADKALPFPLAGLASEGREAGKSGDLFAIEIAEFGQLADQSARDNWSDARDRGEQVLLCTPGWGTAHGIVDIAIKAFQFLLQRLEQATDALSEARNPHPLLALALGSDHLEDLAPASDQIGQQPRCLIGKRTRGRLGGLGKVRDDRSIDRIGLRTLS